MSVNYAAGLSNFPHIHKGKCGLPEIYDSPDVLQKNIDQLVELIKQSKHMVVHTGAGISTSAGIPDFRGPNGVWTLEAKGEAPVVNINFDEAVPTKTHLAILGLQQRGIVKYVVSQNIDGLHLRSGYPRSQLSELHGNMFTEKCEKCGHEYYRRTPVSTMTQKHTGNVCMEKGKRGLTNCRGKLRDTILDWEASLPTDDLNDAEMESKRADLSLCLGTTLQIVPSGRIPLFTLKNNGKLVIVNLQKTKYDKKANILIHAYVDDVMEGVMKGLGFSLPEFHIEYYLSTIKMLPDDIKKIKKDIKDESKQIKRIEMKSEDSNDSKEILDNIHADSVHVAHRNGDVSKCYNSQELKPITCHGVDSKANIIVNKPEVDNVTNSVVHNTNINTEFTDLSSEKYDYYAGSVKMKKNHSLESEDDGLFSKKFKADAI